MNRGSSVFIETRLRPGWPGFISQRRQCWDFFSSPPRQVQLWGATSLLFKGYWRLLL